MVQDGLDCEEKSTILFIKESKNDFTKDDFIQIQKIKFTWEFLYSLEDMEEPASLIFSK